MAIKIDTKKINNILQSIDGIDLEYLFQCLEIRKSISNLMIKFDLTEDDIVKHFEISKRKVKNFINGSYGYNLCDLVNINSLFMQLETEGLKKNVPIQTAKNEPL